MKINLLPWREQRRKMRRKLSWIMAVLILLSLMAFLLSCFTTPTHSTPPMKPTANTPPSSPKLKYIGLIRQGTRTWGMIMLADGSTLDVQPGTNISQINATVQSITPTELVIQQANQPPNRVPYA